MTGTGPPDVRVGIVSWNTADMLATCLDALPRALGDLRWEAVVVDNDSADESVAVARDRPSVTVVENDSNVGYARAMNRALASTAAPALLALNPDTEPPPGSLANLVEDLRRFPTAGLVVPRLRNADGTLQHSVHRFPGVTTSVVRGVVPLRLRRGPVGRRWWLEGFAPHDRSQVLRDAWAIGAVHCIRRQALDGELPYREAWFMYTEDMDLCWRVQRRGWDVVLDAAVGVPHVGNAAAKRAWSPWEREERVLRSTQGWVREVHGPSVARRVAAADAMGATAKLAVSQVGALARSEAAERRLAEHRTLASFYLRQVVAPAGRGEHERWITAVAPAPLRRAKESVVEWVGPELAINWYLQLTRWPRAIAGWRRERAAIQAVRSQLGAVPTADVITLIPTYQRPELVRHAVASALAQGRPDHLVLVLNDGGVTPDLPEDERLVSVDLPFNLGRDNLVRNVGLAVTRSRVVAFLDDDNTWRPDHLDVSIAALEGADLAYTAVERVREDGSVLDVISWPFDRRLMRKRHSVDTSSITVRREIGVRFSRLPRTAGSPLDWELVWRLSRRHRVVHVPDVTVRYLVNPRTFYSRWSDGESAPGGGPAQTDSPSDR